MRGGRRDAGGNVKKDTTQSHRSIHTTPCMPIRCTPHHPLHPLHSIHTCSRCAPIPPGDDDDDATAAASIAAIKSRSVWLAGDPTSKPTPALHSSPANRVERLERTGSSTPASYGPRCRWGPELPDPAPSARLDPAWIPARAEGGSSAGGGTAGAAGAWLVDEAVVGEAVGEALMNHSMMMHEACRVG